MFIQDVLKAKGGEVVEISSGGNVVDAVRLMVAKKVGAVLVVDIDRNPLGIFTERDNLRITAAENVDPGAAVVDDYMSRDLVVGLPADKVEEAMAVMTDQRVRHLPILEEGKLIGLVSIGDLVKATSEKYRTEARYLHQYITDTPYAQ